MKITILGCGASGGVPLIGGSWGLCDPENPRNRRLRVSILVETEGTVVLVDTSPDLRAQLLGVNIKQLDGVLYTHAHADHCHGINDLRSVNWLIQKPVDLYADSVTLAALKEAFAYVFAPAPPGIFYRPVVTVHEITGPFTVGALSVQPFKQQHGKGHSLGFRFGPLAYSTDVHAFGPEALDTLRGIKIWIIDCAQEHPHLAHLHLAKTLEYIDLIKPERAYLTHMTHHLDYETLRAKLPSGVEPAYDGLEILC